MTSVWGYYNIPFEFPHELRELLNQVVHKLRGLRLRRVKQLKSICLGSALSATSEANLTAAPTDSEDDAV